MSEPALLDVRLTLVRPAPLLFEGSVLGRVGASAVVLTKEPTLVRAPSGPREPLALVESAALVHWPVAWEGATERYHVLVAGREKLSQIVDQLGAHGRVTLESAMPAPVEAVALGMPWLALGARLTPRQLQALRAAIERGYYDIPRRVAMEDLARDLGLARATLQEHLRKAERATLRELARHLPAVGTGFARKGPGRPALAVPLRS